MRCAVFSMAVAAVAQEMPEMAGLHAKCGQAISELSNRGFNDQEVAAYCRAAYPMDMCKSMKASLGSLPWSQERIDTTCQGWEARVAPKLLAMPAERRDMSFEDLQKTLDDTADAKAKVGYNMPRNEDGSVNMEEAARLKYAQTLQVQEAYNSYMYGDDDSQVQEKVQEKVAAAGEALGDAADQVQETAEEGSAALGDAASQVKEAVAGSTRLFETDAPPTRHSHVGVALAGFVLGSVTVAGVAFVTGRRGSSTTVASLEAGLAE